MAYARNGRNRRAYRRKAKRTIRTGDPCWICKQPIDPNLDYRHPMSGTADHLNPLAKGGDILGPLKPAHRKCNSARGADRKSQPQPPAITSRAW